MTTKLYTVAVAVVLFVPAAVTVLLQAARILA